MNIFFPFHSWPPMVKRRAYQPIFISGIDIPLKGLAQEKGTRIFAAKDPGLSCQFSFSPAAAESAAKFQYPLRFCHALLSKSGRGCSFSGMSTAGCLLHESRNATIGKRKKDFFMRLRIFQIRY